MTQKDKELLLKDICGRLPYEPIVKYTIEGIWGATNITSKLDTLHIEQLLQDSEDLVDVKPYLRPMSSQTSKEREELNNILQYQYCSDDSCMCEATDWLNAHHFDYRGLIEKGLAIEVTEENNPYKD